MQSTYNGETITVGALAVRFLVEAGESNGSVAVFECDPPRRPGRRRPTATTPLRRRSTD